METYRHELEMNSSSTNLKHLQDNFPHEEKDK